MKCEPNKLFKQKRSVSMLYINIFSDKPNFTEPEPDVRFPGLAGKFILIRIFGILSIIIRKA